MNTAVSPEIFATIQALVPNATDYFDFSTRRYVGNVRKTLGQVASSEGMKSWELWVAQALAALAKLHEAGFLHGGIQTSTLVINEDGNLRLGGLQKARERTQTGPTEPFAPNNLVLPPEQNLYAAFQNSVPFETAYQSLTQANWPMDQLETVFPRITFKRPVLFGLYERIQSASSYADMQQAGDVWMLGFSLLSKYYEMLEWPYVTQTDFYQTKHEDFHDLIEQMVSVNPSARISAAKALALWVPQEVQAAQNQTVQQVSEVTKAAAASDASADPAAAATAVASQNDHVHVNENEHLPVPSANETTTDVSVPVKRRPYLTLQSHPAGRSKTRRSLRNSNPSSATSSSAQPIVG